MQNEHSNISESSDLLTLQGQIIDALNCGVLAYTLHDHNVIVVNDTLKHIYGLGGADSNTLGRAVIMSIIPEDAPAVKEVTGRLKHPGDSVDYIYRIARPDGEIVTLKAFTTRRAFVDGREYILSVIENISVEEGLRDSLSREEQLRRELKEAYDAANSANEAKTRFLASMSHDIRTPMNAIIGMTAIAGAHLDDIERVADCLEKITTSSEHLLGLINEVLDMNKIESGKLDLFSEEFSISDLIENIMTMIRPQMRDHGHELIVNTCNVVHEKVIGDSQRVKQIFMNILGNAVKYTPDGGRIEMIINEKPANHTRVGCYEFIFRDNGIGMDEDFIPHIFEAFARAKDAEKMQGTGLGMAIANNIAHMMNGDIKVKSRRGEGSEFTVTIYLKLQNVDEEPELKQFENMTVLVADNDRGSCESIRRTICELGMKCEWVLSGAEAIELAARRHEENNDYLAVILAWKMTETDGLSAAKEIRRAAGDEIPIIFISAYDWSDIEQEARSAGVSAFIGKPVFRSKLVRTFRKLLCGDEEAGSAFSLTNYSNEDFSDKRALLAEDNRLNSEIAGDILSMTGLSVDFAFNGKEAVEKVAASEDGYYDIIFMDIQMPEMNGYEAAKAIRAMDREYAKNVPILAVTANAFAQDVQEVKDAGMNEHISKPINFEELLKALRRWLT